MIIDVQDIYGKLHYFLPQHMCSVDEVAIELKGEIGPDGKTKTINVFEVNMLNGKSFYITEEVRQTFMSPQEEPVDNQGVQVEQKEIKPGDVVEEGAFDE